MSYFTSIATNTPLSANAIVPIIFKISQVTSKPPHRMFTYYTTYCTRFQQKMVKEFIMYSLHYLKKLKWTHISNKLFMNYTNIILCKCYRVKSNVSITPTLRREFNFYIYLMLSK